jgi:hypothetical protein
MKDEQPQLSSPGNKPVQTNQVSELSSGTCIINACISFLSSKSTAAFANDYVVNSSSQRELLNQFQKGCNVWGEKGESDLERATGMYLKSLWLSQQGY